MNSRNAVKRPIVSVLVALSRHKKRPRSDDKLALTYEKRHFVEKRGNRHRLSLGNRCRSTAHIELRGVKRSSRDLVCTGERLFLQKPYSVIHYFSPFEKRFSFYANNGKSIIIGGSVTTERRVPRSKVFAASRCPAPTISAKFSTTDATGQALIT